jgi:hypothetical protein
MGKTPLIYYYAGKFAIICRKPNDPDQASHFRIILILSKLHARGGAEVFIERTVPAVFS